jgi:uncharacterized membrane protein YqgA involved in biofilm formation
MRATCHNVMTLTWNYGMCVFFSSVTVLLVCEKKSEVSATLREEKSDFISCC